MKISNISYINTVTTQSLRILYAHINQYLLRFKSQVYVNVMPSNRMEFTYTRLDVTSHRVYIHVRLNVTSPAASSLADLVRLLANTAATTMHRLLSALLLYYECARLYLIISYFLNLERPTERVFITAPTFSCLRWYWYFHFLLESPCFKKKCSPRFDSYILVIQILHVLIALTMYIFLMHSYSVRRHWRTGFQNVGKRIRICLRTNSRTLYSTIIYTWLCQARQWMVLIYCIQRA